VKNQINEILTKLQVMIMWHFIGRHLIARQLNGDISTDDN